MNGLNGEPVRASAANVIDWYRGKLAEALHDLAFAQTALGESQQATELLRNELGSLHGELDALQAQLADAAGRAGGSPTLDDPEFGAWVAVHWSELEDARIADAVEHPERPHVPEQP